jgi:hypothetical protein
MRVLLVMTGVQSKQILGRAEDYTRMKGADIDLIR